MFSFPYSCRKKFLCCYQEEAPESQEMQDESEVVPDWPEVPSGPPVSNFANLRIRVGEGGVFGALAKILSKRALEEAVQEIWDADSLGAGLGCGDFAPQGGGNGDEGRVGESGDCAPCDLMDPAQPLVQLPLRCSREQNALRLTRILRSLDLKISCLEKYSDIGFPHNLRRRFRGVFRTVENAYPGLMVQALVRRGV